ncbi:hypothetical protein IGI96_003791 [Enterococcus sp. DIV0421]
MQHILFLLGVLSIIYFTMGSKILPQYFGNIIFYLLSIHMIINYFSSEGPRYTNKC